MSTVNLKAGADLKKDELVVLLKGGIVVPAIVNVPKYRKRPVEVEAMEFKTNSEHDDACMNRIVYWINYHGGKARHDSTYIFIATLEGEMRAECSDYIVRGVEGEFYPVKPHIFAKTYEPI